MAEFEAYIDESGIHAGASVTIVVCVVTDLQIWSQLGTRWQRVLRKHGVSAFHGRMLTASQGEYVDWDYNMKRRYLTDLCGVLDRYTPTIIAVGVREQLFSHVKSEFPNVRLSAYQFCCDGCIGMLHHFAKTSEQIDKIAVVIGAGQKWHSKMVRQFKSALAKHKRGTKLQSIAEKPTTGSVPLQVADFCSHVSYQVATPK